MKTRLLTALTLALAEIAVVPFAGSAQEVQTDYNYVGVGVGIGDLGDGDFGLAINGKATLGDHVSLRPAVMSDLDFGSDGETVFLAPITYDFNSILSNGRLLPFIGGGVSVSTEDDGAVGPLLTAGADYRINDRLTANGSVNWSIYGDSQVNGLVGLGYTF